MKKVLVIDDDQGVRQLITSMVRAGGYEAVEASSGGAGAAAFGRDRFDLVITDLFMPGQNGFETIKQIRALDGGVPIVAVCGFGWDETSGPLGEALAAGADRVFGKPFLPHELIGAMRELLGPTA